MKTRLAILLSCLAALSGFAQGFVNLSFEFCTLPTNSTAMLVPVGSAFPGWTVYAGGVAQSQVAYNGGFPQQSFVSLNATAQSFPALFGDYNARFALNSADSLSISLGQTALVPTDAFSLQFKTAGVNPVPNGGLSLSFNGTPLAFQQVGVFPGYTLWSANISPFAGTIGELRFTGNQVGFNWATYFDDFQFTPVPEPSTWALLALGSAAFAGMARRRRNR